MCDDNDSSMSWDDLEQERQDLGDLMGSQEEADIAIEQAERGEYEG